MSAPEAAMGFIFRRGDIGAATNFLAVGAVTNVGLPAITGRRTETTPHKRNNIIVQKKTTLVEIGAFPIEVNLDIQDPQVALMVADAAAGVERYYEIEFPDAVTLWNGPAGIDFSPSEMTPEGIQKATFNIEPIDVWVINAGA